MKVELNSSTKHILYLRPETEVDKEILALFEKYGVVVGGGGSTLELVTNAFWGSGSKITELEETIKNARAEIRRIKEMADGDYEDIIRGGEKKQ